MSEVAFFDIDDTLIKGQSAILFVKYLYKKGKLNFKVLAYLFIWMFFYKARIIRDIEPAMRKGFSVFEGWKVDEVNNLVDDFFENILKSRIYPQALSEIEDHKKNNRKIVLISNAPQVVVNRFVKSFRADYGFGTQLEIIGDSFTGKILGRPMYSEKKVELGKKIASDNGWDLARSWAYSDHYSDIGLLQMVGNPIAVNPDKELSDYAKENNWKIIYFNL